MSTFGLSIPTCNEESVYISNHHLLSNLTHVFYYDASAGTYSANLQDEALPQDLYPAVPAVNDIVYFGIDATARSAGPFASLVFDLSQAQVDLTTITWQYWNGAWVALTVLDNTNADGLMTGDAFDTIGIKSVHWVQQSDWIFTAINGITGWWVRAIIGAIGAGPDSPIQQNRHVYAIQWPYIDIDEDDIDGDIEALINIKIRNQSEKNPSLPLSTNRLIVGLRSISRGSKFTPYINLSNVDADGYSVAVGGSSAFNNDAKVPTNYYVVMTNAPAAWADQVTVTFGTDVFENFSGTFRAFLVGDQTSGTAGSLLFRLKTEFTGGLSFISSVQTPFKTAGLDFSVIDLGIITLPPSGSVGTSEESASLNLMIQAYGNGADDANLYTLVLMPVDEWSVDTLGDAYAAQIYNRDSLSNTYGEIDSIFFPKRRLRTLIKNFYTDNITTTWQAIGNGSAILHANTNQRLWFFSMESLTASYWRAKHETSNSIQIEVLQRYFSLRGDN